MPDLVTKQDAYEHLRLDYDTNGSPDDAWLDVWILAVSEAVLGWLKDEWRAYVPELGTDGLPMLDSNDDPVPALDSNGDYTPKPSVRAAVLVELERQYRFRGGETHETDEPTANGWGYTLGKGAVALLTPLRKPTVA